MSAILCLTTDAMLDKCTCPAVCPARDEMYATAPMLAVLKPAARPLDEETLHTQFEEAISYRLDAVNERLSRLSHPALGAPVARYQTDPLLSATSMAPVAAKRVQPFRFIHGWQRAIVYACIAISLTLLGFDLMGMLVLLTR